MPSIEAKSQKEAEKKARRQYRGNLVVNKVYLKKKVYEVALKPRKRRSKK